MFSKYCLLSNVLQACKFFSVTPDQSSLAGGGIGLSGPVRNVLSIEEHDGLAKSVSFGMHAKVKTMVEQKK